MTASVKATPGPVSRSAQHPPVTPTPHDPSTPVKPKTGPDTVYLRFDDGPSASTPAILEILTRQQATATFVELGIRRAALPHVAVAAVSRIISTLQGRGFRIRRLPGC